MRIKDNKKKKTKPSCTFVVARLSSSESSSLMVPIGKAKLEMQCLSHADSCRSCFCEPCLETSPTPYRRLRALRARSVPGSVRESVPENQGVRESVRGSVSGGLESHTPKSLAM